MAERPDTRREDTDFQWAELDKTELAPLSGGLKDAGYPDGATPANEEHNELFENYYNVLRHFYGQVPRLFDTLGEALDLIGVSSPLVPIELGDHFVVDGLRAAPGGFIRKLGDGGLSFAAGSAVIDLACDGQRIYFAGAAFIASRNNLGSTASTWSVNPGTPNFVTALDSDGLHVYASYITSDDVFLLNPATGATIATITTPTNLIPDLAANGLHLLVAQQVSNLVKVYTSLGASPTFVADTLTHGADVNAVALDHDQGYLTGDASTLINVRAFSLASPGAFLWSTELPGVATGFDIKTDNAFVYLVSSQSNTMASAWCLRRSDGAIVWRAAVAGGIQLEHLAIDHRYMWVTDVNDVTYALDKSSGAELFRTAVAFDNIVRCADGHQAFSHRPSGSFFIQGLLTAEYRTFRRVLNTESERRPFPRLALPEAEPPLGSATDGLIEDIAEGTGTTTTISATDVLAAQMTITPPAGRYQVWFSGSVDHSAVNSTIFTNIYAGGVRVAQSERRFRRGTVDIAGVFACMARVDVDGTQAIEGQWRTTVSTATMYERQLMIRSV